LVAPRRKNPEVTIMRRIMCFTALAAPIALAACAVAPPTGPNVVAMPGQGKSFEAFQQDDGACRGWASQQTGGVQPAQAATDSAVGSAVVGTALGAAAGAAIGAAAGGAGVGAAIGAATGLIAGTAVGASNAQVSGGNVQARYDTAYAQCMSAKGDSVQTPQPSYAGGYPYAAAYPAYGYGYPYAYPYYYGPGYIGPTVVVGGGWGGWGWRGGYRHW
jgi:hypothetical protein